MEELYFNDDEGLLQFERKYSSEGVLNSIVFTSSYSLKYPVCLMNSFVASTRTKSQIVYYFEPVLNIFLSQKKNLLFLLT